MIKQINNAFRVRSTSLKLNGKIDGDLKSFSKREYIFVKCIILLNMIIRGIKPERIRIYLVSINWLLINANTGKINNPNKTC